MIIKPGNTLQQKFGFNDADMTTPQHDKIMLWLDMNADAILQTIFPPTDWNEQDQVIIQKYGITDVPTKKIVRVESKRWEHPIVTSKEFTIGFIDMLLKYQRAEITEWHSDYPRKYGGVIQWEDYDLYFEVKSSIPSAGELIRQIRMYQTYVESPFVVVSPDDRFVHILTNQGIRFVKYEPE